MKIEVVTLVEIDLDKERVRIRSAFARSPKIREELMSLVDRFEQGKFEELALELSSWKRENLEYIHSVIFDVLKGIRNRQLRQQNLEELKKIEATLSAQDKELSDLVGVPRAEAGAQYPQYRVV